MSFHSQQCILRAMTTNDGTAAAETALCNDCDSDENRVRLEGGADSDLLPRSWAECSENSFLVCQVCGMSRAKD